jgi:hypothetical protein
MIVRGASLEAQRIDTSNAVAGDSSGGIQEVTRHVLGT